MDGELRANMLVHRKSGWCVEQASVTLDSGEKARGLAAIPERWGKPWLSLPISSCRVAEETATWMIVAKCIIDHLATDSTESLLVRSSSPTEDLNQRGFYESAESDLSVDALAQTLRKIAYQSDSHFDGEPKCAVVIQQRVPTVRFGHLSNEYRHAQRAVDFIYESFSGIDDESPYLDRFRLPRPVAEPETASEIAVDLQRASSLDLALKGVATWLASKNTRGHLEWVASSTHLYVVQFDRQDVPPRKRPLDEYTGTHSSLTSESIASMKLFRAVSSTPCADLRKTRSHAILSAAGVKVPDVFVAPRIGASIDQKSADLRHDLDVLLSAGPIIVRFDVSMEKSEWTNLPTVGPLTRTSDALESIAKCVEKTDERKIERSELTLVVHHFIPARACAWSEGKPDTHGVRIDATWGMPDGLQSFVHDSLQFDTETEQLSSEIRYKDRFIDVGSGGDSITRIAYPALAREHVCDLDTVREIAVTTRRVARQQNKTVRIMWFLDVFGSANAADRLVPWIVVDLPDDHSSDRAVDPVGTEHLRRQADLYHHRRIHDRRTLELFKKDPKQMDLGQRHVLFEPDASAVRDRTFLKDFADTVKSLRPQWKVAYGGSMLAHAPYQLQQYEVAVIALRATLRPTRNIRARKLVRDRIPDRIQARGEVAATVQLSDRQYQNALREKLIEEALEVAYATNDEELREELADLLAVSQAIEASSQIGGWELVVEEEKTKADRVGRFEKRIYLQSTGTNLTDNQQSIEGSSVRGTSPRTMLISLVPPLISQRQGHRIRFPEYGVEMLVRYAERNVRITVSNLTRLARRRAENQLSLPFGDGRPNKTSNE